MSAWLKAFPLRLMFAFTWALVMGWAPWPDPTTGQLPTWFYAVAMCNLVLYRLACNVMFVSQMAFFSRVADPSIGGTYVYSTTGAAGGRHSRCTIATRYGSCDCTCSCPDVVSCLTRCGLARRYMTLLNTLANLGTMWVSPTALMAIDWATVKSCYASVSTSVELTYSCDVLATMADTAAAGLHNATTSMPPVLRRGPSECSQAGGVCLDKVDGYETVTVVCVALGWLWLFFMRPTVLRLERSKVKSWHVT